MHPARQQCNAWTPKYLAKLSTRYIVFPENLIVADIFPNFMFKYLVYRSHSVDPILSQFSPVLSYPFSLRCIYTQVSYTIVLEFVVRRTLQGRRLYVVKYLGVRDL